MRDNSGHRERIRQKYLQNGINSLQEYEILELLLTYCIPRKDTKELAKKLLKQFRNIEKILKLNEEELRSIDGLGKTSICFLKLMGELPNIFYKNNLENSENILIKNKENLIKYLRSLIAYEKIEKFYVLYLSSSNKLITCQEKSYGTLDKSAVYPREIYKDVLKYNAKAVILAHNHPSGNINPSQSDKEITKEIAKGLMSFDAILIEHIIISDNSYFSFLEEGLI